MRQATGFRPLFVLTAALLVSASALAAQPAAPASAASSPSAPLVDACPAQLPVKQTVSEAIAGWTP